MFEFNTQKNLMTLDKYPVGNITRIPDGGGWLVQDVRGRERTYKTMNDAFNHFHNFVGWKEYVGYRDKPKNRTVRKETGRYKRWALT